MTMVWQSVFIFVAMAISDFLWAQYIIATTNQRSLKASIWSASIALVNGAVILTYVKSPWLILVAAAGAFVGTFLSIKRAQHQTNNQPDKGT
jgi:hypothetical protein